MMNRQGLPNLNHMLIPVVIEAKFVLRIGELVENKDHEYRPDRVSLFSLRNTMGN